MFPGSTPHPGISLKATMYHDIVDYPIRFLVTDSRPLKIISSPQAFDKGYNLYLVLEHGRISEPCTCLSL